MPNFSFTAPDGSKWDSKFEWEVYEVITGAGIPAERCVKPSDTIGYSTPQRGARCLECGSAKVGVARKYTADLRIPSGGAESGFRLVEAKGYFRGNKRSLFGHVVQHLGPAQLVTVLQTNYDLGLARTPTIADWIESKGGVVMTFTELKNRPERIYE